MGEIASEGCVLVSGLFALLVQIFLGLICVGTLVYKRHREVPKRDLETFALDASKQGLGAAYGHVGNIFLSVYITNVTGSPITISSDECQWYCLSYLADSSLGTLISICLLISYERLCARFCPFVKKSGDYGNPPQVIWWLYQLIVWMLIISIGKLILFFIIFELRAPLDALMDAFFTPVKPYPKVELLLVMIILPACVNVGQFWITDTYLKMKNFSVYQTHTPLTQHDYDDEQLSKAKPHRRNVVGLSLTGDLSSAMKSPSPVSSIASPVRHSPSHISHITSPTSPLEVPSSTVHSISHTDHPSPHSHMKRKHREEGLFTSNAWHSLWTWPFNKSVGLVRATVDKNSCNDMSLNTIGVGKV